MKKLLSILTIMSLFFVANAQNTIRVNDKVTVKGDFDINFVLDAHHDKNEHCDVADGYRIQVMNSSNREDVYAKKAEVYGHFTEFKGYIVYDQPYYKLRVGDFHTKLEARRYLDEIIGLFPTAFIVKDEIRIK